MVAVRYASDVVKRKVTRQQHPNIFEALLLLCSVDGETVREKRYLAVSSAYEVIRAPIDIDAIAIRHAFAHAPGALKDPRIVRSLTSRFGSLHPNLKLRDHRKELFRCMATMLINVDKAIAKELELST